MKNHIPLNMCWIFDHLRNSFRKTTMFPINIKPTNWGNINGKYGSWMINPVSHTVFGYKVFTCIFLKLKSKNTFLIPIFWTNFQFGLHFIITPILVSKFLKSHSILSLLLSHCDTKCHIKCWLANKIIIIKMFLYY